VEEHVIDETADLEVWSLRTQKGEAQALRESIIQAASVDGAELLVLRGDMVFGADQIRSALYHAKMSIRAGTNSSESLAMETLLYASGERQLSTAIDKMSVDQETEEVAIAKLASGRIRGSESWQRMPAMKTDIDRKALARFGISDDELTTQSSAKAYELVLEKVAAVDVMKK